MGGMWGAGGCVGGGAHKALDGPGLAAECLGLERVEVGRDWDYVNRRYKEVVVLGIWG